MSEKHPKNRYLKKYLKKIYSLDNFNYHRVKIVTKNKK